MKEAIKAWLDKEYIDHPHAGTSFAKLEKELVGNMIGRCMADIGGGWISIDVMTPADEMRVAALVDGVSVITVARHGIDLNSHGKLATHWMPLPEPPTL